MTIPSIVDHMPTIKRQDGSTIHNNGKLVIIGRLNEIEIAYQYKTGSYCIRASKQNGTPWHKIQPSNGLLLGWLKVLDYGDKIKIRFIIKDKN